MELKGQVYRLDGLNILDLVEKYGDPLYLYSGDTMHQNYRKLQAAFHWDSVHIMYACKALTNVSVLKLFKKWGSGLDAVSVEEIRLGKMAGFSGSEIIFTPSMVREEDYDFAVEEGVRVNVGDLSALEYMSSAHPEYPLCIRINPHIYAGGHHKISVGHEHSKFGISIFQLEEMLELIKSRGIRVEGLHIHAGSDIQDDNHYLRAIDVLFEVAQSFRDLKYVDIGSGFKSTYNQWQKPSNLEKIAGHVKVKLEELSEAFDRKIELLLEPGKLLVSNAGFFLARVNTVKHSARKVFLGLNTGFNHFVRPMLYDAFHEIVNLSNPGGEKISYEVVGYICETDTFAKERIIDRAKAGDILAFCNAGAYGYHMASNYNSKLRPPEVLIVGGVDYLIRRGETFSDLTTTLVDPEI